MSNDSNPVVAEQVYTAPVEAVWTAITDEDQMRQWFFNTMKEFEPKVGFETVFDVECEGQVYPHHWKVTDVIPGKQIVYDWKYDGIQGDSTVAWDLSLTLDGTKLVLTHTGIETFPQDNPVFTRESTQAGWDYFLHDSLKSFLEQQG